MHATGVIRLVSPQPTVPLVLLPPAGSPHSWDPLSQVLAVVLQVSYKLQVQCEYLSLPGVATYIAFLACAQATSTSP